MNVLCIFKGDLLIDQQHNVSITIWESLVNAICSQTEDAPEDFEVINFIDEELNDFLNPSTRPNYFMKLDKEKIYLYKQTLVQEEMEVEIRWENCDAQQLPTHFSPEQITLINENMNFYNGLSEEAKGQAFEWPHQIARPLATVMGNTRAFVLHKEILGEKIN